MVDYNTPASQSDVDAVLDIPGVVSVGEGMRGGETVMIVGVEDPALVDNPQIPSKLGGLDVVVDVEGRPGFSASRQPEIPLAPPGGAATLAAGVYAGRYRPAPPGVSIGHPDVTAGTSSFLATDGSSFFQLSNNHVLAPNGATAGDSIIQPGSADGGGVTGDAVGELSGWVGISDTDNRVDIAWYSPSDDVTAHIIDLEPPSSQSVDPEVGDDVTFIGRTSGVMEATVDRAHSAILVGDDAIQFVDQFRIDTPLVGGDSGCPVVKMVDGGPKPVGVGFASTDTGGWCMYASNVEEETGLTMATVDGTEPSQAGVSGGTVLVGAGLALALARSEGVI